MSDDTDDRVKAFREAAQALRDAVAEVVVGQKDVVEEVMICLFAGGHALLEGVPGIGKTLLGLPGRRRVGVVGLGIGTLAAYGREGDSFRFYELDPDVHELATSDFSYLSDSGADVSVAIGDGRLLLAHEDSQRFNLLVLDAFASDAVPVHLLTLEAFEIYARHVAPGGVIAVNVTNHHLDLRPIVAAAAREHGWHWKYIEGRDDEPTGQMYSEWMLIATDQTALAHLPPGELDPETRELPPWTDDFSNLFRILR